MKYLMLLMLMMSAAASAAREEALPEDGSKIPTKAAAAATAEQAFERLTELVGTWKGKFADGREHQVSYRLTAGGTVLMETWALAPGRESISMYHLDADALIATHYCPQGNQPRLQWLPGDDLSRLDFAFRDGTNLTVAGRAHQHAMWIEPGDRNAFRRGETYVDNGSGAEQTAAVEPGETIAYTRIDSGE